MTHRFGIWNFGHCDLFVICDLKFFTEPKSFLFDQTECLQPEAVLNVEP